jgi:ankyrin repeat protein
MNKFDKPYRIAPSFDSRKNIEMFDLASRLDTHEMLQHSLINQISFDIADEEANTLIHIVINVDSRKASQHSKLGVIKFLVNNGANPDKPNKYNQTPLHLACHYQYDLIVEYLSQIFDVPIFNKWGGKIGQI